MYDIPVERGRVLIPVVSVWSPVTHTVTHPSPSPAGLLLVYNLQHISVCSSSSLVNYYANLTQRFVNVWSQFKQIVVIFKHLRLWIAVARHNLKWLKNKINKLGFIRGNFYTKWRGAYKKKHFLWSQSAPTCGCPIVLCTWYFTFLNYFKISVNAISDIYAKYFNYNSIIF